MMALRVWGGGGAEEQAGAVCVWNYYGVGFVEQWMKYPSFFFFFSFLILLLFFFGFLGLEY